MQQTVSDYLDFSSGFVTWTLGSLGQFKIGSWDFVSLLDML
jgi:hypothetical protein